MDVFEKRLCDAVDSIAESLSEMTLDIKRIAYGLEATRLLDMDPNTERCEACETAEPLRITGECVVCGFAGLYEEPSTKLEAKDEDEN